MYKSNHLTIVDIPEEGEIIGDGAFRGCSNLTTVNLSENVRSIGDEAFMFCSNLTTIKLPEMLKSIKPGLFAGCTGLTAINIPQRVASIGSKAFYNCKDLTTICIRGEIQTIDDYAFLGCDKLRFIIILAKTYREFRSTERYLPWGFQHLADHNGVKKFRFIMESINKLLVDHPAGVEDNALTQVTNLIEEAGELLESIKSYDMILYQEQKKELDSLIVSVHLHQNDLRAALRYYQGSPNLNPLTITNLATAIFTLSDIDLKEKHKAMIALFKVHHHIPAVQDILAKSVLYLLSNAEPSLGETLQAHGIDKCVPLALMQEHMKEATKDLNDDNPLKHIHQYLHLLTQQEIRYLIGMSPIKEVFAQNPKLGSGTVLPYESFYGSQPAFRSLPEESERFLKTTLTLIGAEKRAGQEQTTAIEQNSIAILMENVYPPLEDTEQNDAAATDTGHAQNVQTFFNQPSDSKTSSSTPSSVNKTP